MQTRLGFILGKFIGLLLLASGCSLNTSSSPQSVSGTIETDEVHIASRYGGRVEKILAEEGAALKAGQVLVELEAAELRARREQAAAQLAEWEAGSRTEVYALNDPPARGDSRKIDDDGNAAQAILDFLAEKRLV